MFRIRTGFSFRSSAGTVADVMSVLSEHGETVAPITDRASTFGFGPWKKAAEAAGIRPVYGVELAVSTDRQAKKPPVDYWTFIARDNLSALNNAIGLATEQFRYQPVLSINQALSFGDDLIVASGARTNPSLLPAGHRVLLSPSTPMGLYNAAVSQGMVMCASSDNRYPRPDDRGFWQVLCGRGAEAQSYTQHIMSKNEWMAWALGMIGDVGAVNKAIENSEEALDASRASLQTAQLVTPPRPATLREMCLQGASALGCNLSDPVYAARLDRELELIASKSFEDYFYLVADICQWARERMLVGPARGSSCGSLVCYLLGITTVDPIPFGLIFERFIDVNRNDLPDIDIDFSDQQRHLVFEYVEQKYGAERVARLGTVNMFQPRSALQEVGGALDIPPWERDKVVDSLIERSSGDARALDTLGDTLAESEAGKELIRNHPEVKIAARFEGHPRHAGQHAAGIVISEQPLTDIVTVDRRTGATMCDKKDAEDLYGLLKIDALGLTQLSIFEDALEMAGLPINHLFGLPLDDKAAFDVLNKAQWSGIFQFNGMALQSLTKQIKVERFDDIVSITALGRPGPLASGGAHTWVKRRIGSEAVTYPHEIFRSHLEDTQGVVLYQEQVMNIGREIGDLDWGQVTALRKAMSKSLGKEFFDQFGDPWKLGAIAKGVDPDKADKIWDDLCAYGSWSFNKSHSVAYGLVSYWCCWLKAHHPFEFAAATLSHLEDPEKQLKMLREMNAEGFGYKPVDPEHSTRKWAVGYEDGKKVLVGPLSSVKGIGPRMVSEIMSARARGEPMPSKAQKLLRDPKTPIDSLWPIADAFKRVLPDPTERNIMTPPTKVIDIQNQPKDATYLVFCTLAKINIRDANEAVNIARRGGQRYEGPDPLSLNLQIQDDTDIIFGKIAQWKYKKLGLPIVNRGRTGKAMYAIKGRVRGGMDFRMIFVENVRYIGDMDPDQEVSKENLK